MNKPMILVWSCVAALTLPGCVSARSAGSCYLGENPPGKTPELFAPGVVNTEAIELNGVVSPNGREFFFTRIVDDIFTMYRSVLGADGWSDPRPVRPYESDEQQMAVDMAYAPNGETV